MPEENVSEMYPDLDLAELFYEIEDEFDILAGAMRRVSGTFEGILRHLVSQRGLSSLWLNTIQRIE